MTEEIINKISQSSLITLDLEQFLPRENIRLFDLKPFLFMELILKEKDFRAALAAEDWTQYKDQIVGVFCSADAVIPVWAYMLVASYLQPFAKEVVVGDEKTVINTIFIKRLAAIDAAGYQDKRVIIKGCGDVQVPETAYLEITNKLRPFVKSLMYGEACSNVPVYKRK